MNKVIKIVFVLVVVVNLIFFAVMKLDLFGDRQEEPLPSALHEEKIVLQLTPQSAPQNAQQTAVQSVAASAPEVLAPVESVVVKPEPVTVKPEPVSAPVVAKPVKLACFEWGEFSGEELERVATALKKLQLGNKLIQRDVAHTIGYWVYIAPHKDKAVVIQKVAQLRARGVTDLFVVQEPGEWLNAIQLGVFKSRESAQNFLEGLRAKDVNTAQVGERSGKNKSKQFIINYLDEETSASLIALQKNFAGNELKRVSCH